MESPSTPPTADASPLRVLFLEDSEEDALLVARHLQRSIRQVSYERVADLDSFREALERGAWDLVVSDHAMPRLSAADALAALRRAGGDAPFVVVSGHVTPVEAAEAIRAGAAGCVSKRDLGPLGPLVERAMLEAARRRAGTEAGAPAGGTLAAILDGIPDPVLAVTPEGRVARANRAAERVLGTAAADLEGRDLHDFLPLPVPAPVSGGPWEMAARRADGTSFPAEATLSEVGLPGRRLYLLLLRDVGERKRAEQERLEARLPSALAALAVPLAHDFHNALSAVIGFAHLGQRALPSRHPLRGDLEEIEGLGRRAVALVGQLLSAARVQALARRPIDLNQVVWGSARFLRRILGEGVDLRVSTATDLRVVPADPTLVEQALVNLCRNARDSLPRGGRVTLETRNVRADGAFCRGHPGVRPGDYATIAVSDTGPALDPETLPSLFDPFPLPTGPGPRWGPGLAAVRRIAEQHGGGVDVASLPGEGTTFRVYFPVPEPDGSPPAAASPPTLPRTARRERILLVEEDDALRRSTAGLLESFGYRVAPAAGAEEAERQLRDHAERVGIVVLEAGTPGRLGPSLLEELRAERPGLRALLIADPGGPGAESSSPPGGPTDPVLRKPFTPEELADRLREALGAPSGDPLAEDPAP